MKQVCTWKNVGERKTHIEAFHVQDEKGRWLGTGINTFTSEFSPAGGVCGYPMEPGRYYSVCIQATKDGKDWGASQPTKHFKTAEERADYIKKTVEQRRKAAWKKFPAAA